MARWNDGLVGEAHAIGNQSCARVAKSDCAGEASEVRPSTRSCGTELGASHVYMALRREPLRAREAWIGIVSGSQSLVAITSDIGFADQARMTHTIRAVTGVPPYTSWRHLGASRSISSPPSRHLNEMAAFGVHYHGHCATGDRDRCL